MAEHWTIGRLLDWTTDYLKKYAIEHPHLEAEILLSHTLKVPRINLYTDYERVISPEKLAEFKKLILRRSQREPLPYITGKAWFMSLEFEVSPEVLIPRPETEKLVEVVIELAKTSNLELLADIGTGSGCIAVSLAKYLPHVFIYATDISEKAIEIARANAEKHQVADKINFLKGNLLEPLSKEKFDLIVFNPPYVKTAELKELQPEIKKYEPKKALLGGEEGLDYYQKIIDQAHNYLKNRGCLVFEVGAGQADKVSDLIQETKLYKQPKKVKDYSGIERVVIAQRL